MPLASGRGTPWFLVIRELVPGVQKEQTDEQVYGLSFGQHVFGEEPFDETEV